MVALAQMFILDHMTLEQKAALETVGHTHFGNESGYLQALGGLNQTDIDALRQAAGPFEGVRMANGNAPSIDQGRDIMLGLARLLKLDEQAVQAECEAREHPKPWRQHAAETGLDIIDRLHVSHLNALMDAIQYASSHRDHPNRHDLILATVREHRAGLAQQFALAESEGELDVRTSRRLTAAIGEHLGIEPHRLHQFILEGETGAYLPSKEVDRLWQDMPDKTPDAAEIRR